MKKRPGMIFIGVIAVLLALGFLKDQIIKTAVVIGARQVAGVDVTIDHFSLSFLQQSVRIKDFKVYNPEGFPHEVMVDIPEVSVDYDFPALLKGVLHLPYVRLDLNEVRVIRNKEGKMNVNGLKFAEQGTKETGAVAEKRGGKKPKEIKMRLDLVSLNIGRVIMKDYTVGDKPLVQVYDIHVKDRQYRNVTDAAQFGSLVMLEALKPTAIKGLAAYGAAAFLGAALLPVGVAAIMVGNDSSVMESDRKLSDVCKVVAGVLSDMGEVKKEDAARGDFLANIHGVSVKVEVREDKGKAKVTVSARKIFLPRPEIAAGVIEGLRDVLK